MGHRYLPLIAAATTGILVGAAIVATRFVIGQVSPASLALLRYLIGCCCLVPLALGGPRPHVRLQDVVPIGLLGMVQFGVVVGLLNVALQVLPSARAALIFATSPLLTLMLATVLGVERVTVPKFTGVVLTIVGVGVALGEAPLAGGTAPMSWQGEGAVVGSALSAAVCSVLYRPYVRRYPPLTLSVVAMSASVLLLAVLAAREGFFTALPRLTLPGWGAVFFIGISSGIGYYLWLWALRHRPPTSVTVFLALNPVTATGLGAVFLHERISTSFVAGLLCVAGGLWLAQWQPQRMRDTAES